MPPSKRSTQTQRQPQPRQSAAKLWYAEHMQGRLLWFVGTPLVVGLAALYTLGVLDEPVASTLIATLVIGIACLQAMRTLLEAVSSRTQIGLSVLLVLAGFAAAMASALLAITPGSPAAHGTLQKPGDTLALPAGAHGPLRLLIHGRVAGRDPGSADVALDVGHARVHGELTRTQSRARLGRRGSTMVLHEHNTEFLEVEAPSDADSVRLAALSGALEGDRLDVDVFPDPLPLRSEVALDALLVVLAALLTASSGARGAGVSALAIALLFGTLVHRMATPETAVGPEFGALLISSVTGVLLSTLLVAVAQRLVEARRASS